ncbi:amidase signature enzyme [Myriangium duriaei CBS 260.36]|uniref:Amidase signature enzyme n=1 Tax=Myriangium duriaei CBS 260.36 TaxID=1168546 RepID=A0A9P4MHB1_9PEZI|nr:amidase signature enzyme [Myriangium duriaei CBS 260.36]
MSFPALDNLEPTISEAELVSAASSVGITIPPAQIPAYLKFATAFDSTCIEILSLPPCADPRLAPISTASPRAFVKPSPETNRLNAWSQQADFVASHPKSSRLKGKTVALKGNISVSGAELNNATHAQFFPGGKFHVADVDATVVRRILEAGATIKGVGVCENFCLSALSITAATGPVKNAWDDRRATGGSSSGVATLLSVKDVKEARAKNETHLHGDDGLRDEEGIDMAIGGDQGGSIRVPAHFSGVYGLKPTHGLVPYTGIAGLFSAIDHTGPMTRSIRDAALLLEVIAGADGIDYRQTPWTPLQKNVPRYADLLDEWAIKRRREEGSSASTAAKGLTVGILKEGWAIAGLDDEVAAVTRQAVERFKSLGASVKEVSVPMHMLAGPLWALYNRHGILSNLTNAPTIPLGHPLTPESVLQFFFEYISPINPAISNGLLNAGLLGQKYGPELSRKAQMHVHELTAAFDSVFDLENIDVLVLPVSGKVAPLIPSGVTTQTEQGSNGGTPGTSIHTTLDPLDAASNFVGLTLNTAGFNLTGHPALSMPCGWATPKDGSGPEVTGGKMPVGLQIVGRKWDELGVLKAASLWEIGGKALDEI